MSKRYSIFLSALFCAVLGFFVVWNLITPDREFSPNENSYLQQRPTLSVKDVFSGEFMSAYEEYVTDQFAGRDGWIAAKALCEKLLGKQENDQVYFGADGQTLFAFYEYPADLAQRVDYVNQFAAGTDVPVYFSLIPDKSYVWADRLPANAPNVDDGSTLREAAALCGDEVRWIDLSAALSGADAFYRTDHHWTTFGAYQGYLTLSAALTGSATIPDGSPALVSDDFLGTTWSSCAAGWVEPDEIYTWVSGEGMEVTRYPEGAPVAGELYDESFLAEKDKYSMFLGGNQPLCVIQNPAAEGGRLLILRDSYSDSLAPFLAQDYQELHLIDLRYYRSSLTDYIRQNGIDRVLVLYGASTFAEDTNLFRLTLG